MIVLLGGGTMGAGIAASFLLAGEQVTIVETAADYAEAALTRVTESLERLARRDQNLDVAAHLGRLTIGTDHGVTDDVVLLIEAIPEDVALKQEMLAAVEPLYPDSTIIATNTSSLSIEALATVLAKPGRFIGMHFFNPVPVSALVELVVGSSTDTPTLDAARAWVERIDKTAIVVQDVPGFASSRCPRSSGTPQF